MTAQVIMATPGFERTVLHRSPSCPFLAQTASAHMPLARSFRPAARAASANVTVNAESGAAPSPHAPPENHSPQTPWLSARVRNAV